MSRISSAQSGAAPNGDAPGILSTAHENQPLLGSDRNNAEQSHSLFGTIYEKTMEVLKSNHANWLLIFVPLGIIFGALHKDPVTVFILNFLAIIPLAALLSFATEELSAKLGQTVGGLMNATFGNAVELIVLGCCFISSGLRREYSQFNLTVASTMSSLMAVASVSLIIPATLYAALQTSTPKQREQAESKILLLSRGTALIILGLYILYLYFQLKSHKELFDSEPQQNDEDEDEGERQEGEILPPVPAAIALVIITIGVAICADYLVDSIDAIVERTGISKTFVGLILIPIVGNAAEHVTAVVVSWKNKMDLALGVAVGSSMQIALFVTPFLVILGWAMDRDMTLQFKGFETVVFFLSVLVVNYLIQDGYSNYLEGAMCIGMYFIIAIAFYVLPDDAGDIGASIQGFFSGFVGTP
ncbi:MAG: hypothetical protein Q9162_004971 [Coniocarpon cinnabarinum]